MNTLNNTVSGDGKLCNYDEFKQTAFPAVKPVPFDNIGSTWT